MMVTHVVLWCFALMSGVSAGISRSTPPPLPGFEPTENFALLVIDMQNGFKMGKNNSRILAVAGQVNSSIGVLRGFKHTQRAHVLFTQHGYLDGSTCDHHRNYKRHWAARGVANCTYMQIGTHSQRLVDAISQPESDEPVIHKEVYDAFHQNELHNLLQERGVTTVAIAGWETNVCCDSTARSAFFFGYHVVFLSDATDTSDGRVQHENTLANMQKDFGDVMTASEFNAAVTDVLS